MRRVLVILAATLATCSAAPAGATEFGILTGFSFSNLRIEGRENLQGRSSFAAGVVLDRAFNDRFGIRVEPTFLSKGTKATKRNAYWATMDGAVFKLDYIDVPVLARFDLATTPTRGYAIVGPSVSFATATDAELTLVQTTETVDMSATFKSYDVSLNLGAGVSFPVGRYRLTIDGRGAIGMININDGGTITFDGAPLTVPATPTKTLDFRLFATLLFPVGGQ